MMLSAVLALCAIATVHVDKRLRPAAAFMVACALIVALVDQAWGL